MNKIIKFAALVLALTAVGAGCTKIGENDASNGRTALMKVDATLGKAPQQTVTRAIAEDPTLTPAADRAAEGHVMMITIGGLTEAYEYENGKFIPVGQAVYFTGREYETVDFWLGNEEGTIADQDGTAEMLLSADALTTKLTFSPTNSLSGITLTHVNSLIEVVLDVDPNDVDDVFIGGVPAYNISGTNRYLTIIAPGTEEFKVQVGYKGISDYEVIVGKDAIAGGVKEFTANNRYTLSLSIDEVSLELRLQAISIAQWADAGSITATSPVVIVSTTITLTGDNSNNLTVKFTDGTEIGNILIEDGSYIFEVSETDSPKVIYSIQRLSVDRPIGSEILIGRAVGEAITLNLSGNEVIFRNEVDGSIPIGTYAELALIGTILDGQYIQEADLDLLGFSTASATPQNWVPIGNNPNVFTGIYDGGGKKIENIKVDITGNYAGLFGYCMNSTLQNIHIASGSIVGNQYVGGICGQIHARTTNTIISGCTNSATVTGTGTGTIYVGGICGRNYAAASECIATISDCLNTSIVTGNTYVGGICGSNHAESSGQVTISSCTNAATVTGISIGASQSLYTGGICGFNRAESSGQSTISACYNVGTVTGSIDVGGVSGRNLNDSGISATIIECYSAAAVYGTGNNIGSVCGYSNGTVNYCFWGIGAGNASENNATDAVGNIGSNGITEYIYQFSATAWPGTTSTPGYWNFDDVGNRDDENGKWESLGAWNGTPESSTYPTLKTPAP